MLSQADRASWMKDAACKGTDPGLFFPENGDTSATNPAKMICQGCVVREVCLEYALSEGIEDGIWGGECARERRRIKGRMRQQTHSRMLSGGLQSRDAPTLPLGGSGAA